MSDELFSQYFPTRLYCNTSYVRAVVAFSRTRKVMANSSLCSLIHDYILYNIN
jgi:hypothetical protein